MTINRIQSYKMKSDNSKYTFYNNPSIKNLLGIQKHVNRFLEIPQGYVFY